MVILGINGWFERSHDASATIVVNGKIVAFVEEERPTRHKHAFGILPHRAIRQCLDMAKIDASAIDVIAIGWQYLVKYEERGMRSPVKPDELLDVYLPKEIFGARKSTVKVVQYEHHLAHAASIYRTQVDKDAAVVVLDGQGENASTTIWQGVEGVLTKVLELGVAESLGYLFEAHNRILGFDYLDSGKTMGLSSYGKPYPVVLYKKTDQGLEMPFSRRFKKATSTTDDQIAVVEQWKPILKEAYNLKDSEFQTWATKAKVFSQKEKNIAATVQAVAEDAIQHLAVLAKKKTGASTLCIAGGVGLNCNANMAIWRSAMFDAVEVTPLASDMGVALGAALQAAAEFDNSPNTDFTVYLGPEYSDETIKACAYEFALDAQRVDDPATEAANLLAAGKVIGWFSGRMEAGPRALGNRSILANPGIAGMNDTVNAIKARELWRPLAPSILEEEITTVFEESIKSPHMLFTYTVRPEWRKKVPAITHIDGSSRAQTVSKAYNSNYWKLINTFYGLTGLPLVLNTSFNGPAEPIMEHPREALAMFIRTPLDALVIGNFVVRK